MFMNHYLFIFSQVTLQLITTLCTLVPLVDCSEAYQLRNDLTETERELCSQTAQFQDFIFIFIDRYAYK